jgi:hydrogenase 3 maturation protease
MEISKPSWLALLRQNLERLLNLGTQPRVAILGVGNELRGDDGIGPVVVRALQKTLAGHENLLLADTGPAPENFTGAVRRFAPQLVILIDAALLDAAPGSILWIDWRETAGFSASSHTLPLSVLVEYLTAELGCEVFLIGIQPEDTSFGAPLSKTVENAKDVLVQALTEAFEPLLSASTYVLKGSS